MEPDEAELNTSAVTKLILAAEHYALVCPSVSRFYMRKAESMKKQLGILPTPTSQLCEFCNTVWRPGNHRLSLLPRMRVSKSTKKLQKRLESGRLLGKQAQKMLSFFNDGRNRQVIKCSACKKKSIVLAADRPVKKIPVKDEVTNKSKKKKNKGTQQLTEKVKCTTKKQNNAKNVKNANAILNTKKSLIEAFREKFGVKKT